MWFHGLRWPPLGAAPSRKVTMSGIKSSAVFKGNARKCLINLKKCVTRKGYLCRMTKMNKLSLELMISKVAVGVVSRLMK